MTNNKARDLRYQLAQNEFDGIISMTFNTGTNNGEYTVTLIRFIKSKDWLGLRTWMTSFTHDNNGIIFPGLVARRNEEYCVMVYGEYIT